jgi:hypothetical protein
MESLHITGARERDPQTPALRDVLGIDQLSGVDHMKTRRTGVPAGFRLVARPRVRDETAGRISFLAANADAWPTAVLLRRVRGDPCKLPVRLPDVLINRCRCAGNLRRPSSACVYADSVTLQVVQRSQICRPRSTIRISERRLFISAFVSPRMDRQHGEAVRMPVLPSPQRFYAYHRSTGASTDIAGAFTASSPYGTDLVQLTWLYAAQRSIVASLLDHAANFGRRVPHNGRVRHNQLRRPASGDADTESHDEIGHLLAQVRPLGSRIKRLLSSVVTSHAAALCGRTWPAPRDIVQRPIVERSH